MAYTINYTDGAVFATIADGTINTSSSMILVGKNYAGYGEFLDENFLHLLENSSNTTAPPTPIEGQLWWDSGNSLLKVYNGSTFKTVSAATASSTAPTSNVQGDLWFDTTNQLLKVYTSTGNTFITVGPSVVAGTGAQAVVISDGSVDHDAIQFTVGGDIVAIMSQDVTYTPSPAITGFGTIRSGMQLSTAIANTPLFQGTATDSQLLDGLDSLQFLRSDANDTTTGTLGVLNDAGFTVGVDSDFKVAVNGANVIIDNQTNNGNILFKANVAGTPTVVMTINGSTGTISGNQINANYADVAERFAADAEYEPGTVVSLGGTAEITKSLEELSETVFGVISTQAAYLMNSKAGPSTTHPPVAMTGRVPVKTIGTVRKGDRLVSAGNGLARSAQAGEATAFNVLGRALQDKSTADEGMVEAIVSIKN
jgi:hypothetical protein